MSRKSTPERNALIADLLEKMRRQLQEQLPDQSATLDQIEEAAGQIGRQVSQDIQRCLIEQRGQQQPRPPKAQCACGTAARYKGQQQARTQYRHGARRADFQTSVLPLRRLSTHLGSTGPRLGSG